MRCGRGCDHEAIRRVPEGVDNPSVDDWQSHPPAASHGTVLKLVSGMVSYLSAAVRGVGERPPGPPEAEVARLPSARSERRQQCRSI
jgi:hypothetical protein